MNKLEFWLRYFTVWPGLPVIGNPSDADCILVYSFSRNHIHELNLYLIGKLRSLLGSDKNTLQAMRKLRVNPGDANIGLAQECQTLVNRFGLPVITQWEVALAFDHEWYNKQYKKITCVWPPSERRRNFSTLDVANVASRIMVQNGWRQPLVLGHKRHIARCYLTTEKVCGASPVIVRQTTACFVKIFIHWQTHNFFKWIIYETAARLLFAKMLMF